MIGKTISHYRILEKLGSGGMGVVYKAEDTKLKRTVALKFLPEELSKDRQALERFQREAQAASALNHPHICSLHDIGQEEGVDYLVMEYLEGETLAAGLGKGPLPLAEVLRRGVEIANALDCAHRSGIVHRDLKPGNIMLTKRGAKLMDFGLARATGPPPVAGGLSESPTASRPLTAEGTIVGTFQYMAPEQLEGKEADQRTDLWALGCVLYEMATGKRAFEGTSQATLIAAILKETPRPISELQPLTPPGLDRIVKQCLQKDPDERFQSARDLAFDLEGMTGAGAAASAIAPGGAPAGMRLSAIAIVGIGLAAALLAAGFFLAVRLTERRPQSPTFTRLTFQRGFITNARFTPDGKGVLYSAAWDGRPPEVFETRTDLSTTRSLGLPGISLQSVSRTGELALRSRAEGFAWGYGSLAVVPSSGSAPRDLLEDVSCADWSPDGSTLAVVRRIGGEDHLEMPPGHVLVKTSGWFADVRVSPDSRRIAFTEHSVVNDDRGSVAVVGVAGQKTTLTSEFATVQGLAWSQDGHEIWFSAEANGVQRSLFAVALEGRLRSIARFPSSVVLYDVAPDGRALLASEREQSGIRGRSSADDKERELGWLDFPWPRALSLDGKMLLLADVGETAGPTYTVYLRSMDGSPPVRLGEGSGCALSPDGRWALAIHYGPPHRLVLIPTGPGETLSLPRGQMETYQSGSFLPDGRRIVSVGAERGHPQRTWIQELPGGLPSAVTPEGAVGVATSPDGRWVAAVTQDSTLVLFPLQGGKPKPVAKLAPREAVSQWSADGRTLLVSDEGTHLDVFGIDIQSGKRQLWKTFEVPDPAGVRVVNFLVTRHARSYAYGYLRILDELYLVEGLK
jgi:Tol biopolymer transport system component/tRNA A-37 threonylcarbamoyl transferase component Bud32